MIQFEGYTIQEKLDESARNVLFRAMRDRDAVPVILKVLRSDFPSPHEIGRLRNEYDIMIHLRFDGVVQALSLEKYRNTMALVLEDFGGISLRRWMSNRRMELTTTLRIMRESASILSGIHRSRVIHMDIKPGNIILHPETLQVKITDFGIASSLPQESLSIAGNEFLQGTLEYISPEQTGRMNRSVDHRSDLYSLGVTFYEMLTGRHPFAARDPLELVHSHLAKSPIPPHELDSSIPPVISRIVLKLMAKNAEDRYQSAAGLESDLVRCLQMLESAGAITDFPLAIQDIPDRLQLSEKLYGRENEIGYLLAAFDRIAHGKSDLLLVDGYAGVGKSSLIQEIQRPVVEHRGYFVTGKFDQYKKNIPYLGFILAFQELGRQILTESEERLQYWRENLKNALGPNGKVISDLVPELEHLTGAFPPVADLPPAESRNRFQLVFANFLRVFAKKEHPLVIFLDDLQWADAASLQILRMLMTDPEVGYFLLIGAFRENELTATHPMVAMEEELKKAGKIPDRISLSPLGPESVLQLVVDTLKCSEERGEELARILHKKTAGNPFFLKELLRHLYTERLLRFEGHWVWRTDEMEKVGITDNVVELLSQKIGRLDPVARETLQLASCAGIRFDLQTLAGLAETTPAQVARRLEPALQEGMIFPLSTEYRLASFAESDRTEDSAKQTILYRFSHDRLLQTVYQMVDEKRRKNLHLKIGKLLLHNISEKELGERIFEIVDHLNYGIDEMEDPEEREELARLNLQAGLRAKASTAYESALRYLTEGFRLVGEGWSNYALSLELHMERASCEYLVGNFEQSDRIFSIVLNQSKDSMDQAMVHLIRMDLYSNQVRYEEAVQEGLRGLRLLGLSLSLHPGKLVLLKEIVKAKRSLGKRTIESLYGMADLQDPNLQMRMRLLMGITAPCYLTNQKLFAVVCLEMVNLSLRHGNAPSSAYGYMAYAIVVGSRLGDYEAARKFGDLALRLNEKYGEHRNNAKLFTVYTGFVNHWRNPIHTGLAIGLQGVQAGLDYGDPNYAGYSAQVYLLARITQGSILSEIERDAQKYLEMMDRIRHYSKPYFVGARQFARNLQGLTSNPATFDDAETKEADIERLLEAASLSNVRQRYFMLKVEALYLQGLYREALACSLESEKIVDGCVGMLPWADHYFYNSLILLALYNGSTAAQKRASLPMVRRNQKKMKKWADNCAKNFTHKYLLVEALVAGIHGKHDQAAAHYDLAIELARQNEFLQIEAMGCELAGRYYLAAGRDRIARSYLEEARYCYSRWGAVSVVHRMDEQYGGHFYNWSGFRGDILLESSSSTARSSTSSTASTGSDTSSSSGKVRTLDFSSIIKSSLTISGEIVLENLIRKFMMILIENAGAERGIFLRNRDAKLHIEAEIMVGTENVSVLKNMPLEQCDAIASSVVLYAYRTGESVVLDNALQDNRFHSDPHVQRAGVRSLLCIPIFHQGNLRGLIYLENNLAVGAFTSKRLEIIRLLSSQIAISLENAILYDDLEGMVRKRTQELEGERRKSDQLLLNILPRAIAEELKENGAVVPLLYDGASILFADIRGFTGHAEELSPRALVERLDRFFLQFDMICEGYGLEKIKTIGDAYMCAGGLPQTNLTHPVDVCLAALDMVRFTVQANEAAVAESPWEIRVGIHTGPVVAGVIGKKKFAYDVWGDAVNMAARMESNGVAGRINISETTYQMVKDFFVCAHRGRLDVKNKGLLDMYFLDAVRPEFSYSNTTKPDHDRIREEYIKKASGKKEFS